MNQTTQELIKALEIFGGIGKTRPGWEYDSLPDFVFKNGFAFEKTSDRYKGTWPQGECFRNALQFVQTLGPERFVYVEGYAACIIPVAHAWVYDREDKVVIDPTWKEVGSAYIGVPFDFHAALKFVLNRKRYGLIDAFEIGWPLISGETAYSELAIDGWSIVLENDDNIKEIKNGTSKG